MNESMSFNPVITYLRSNQINETEEAGVNRYRQKSQLQRGFLKTTSNYTEQNNISLLSTLSQVPTVTLLTTRGTRRLTETLIEQRIGIDTYLHTHETPRHEPSLMERSATQYQKSQFSSSRHVSLFQGDIGQSRSSGLFGSSPLIGTKLVQQGISQYLLMEKPTSRIIEFFSSSAELNLNVGPKSIHKSQLFRQF